MQQIKNIIELIESSISSDASHSVTSGGIIEKGYDVEVDELRYLIENANNWLNEYTQSLISKTQISTLRIKYTNQIGYFIEIPLSQKSKIPDDFIHKSTLVNNIRYTSRELGEFESKIIDAESKLYQREYELFGDISKKISQKFEDISLISSQIARLDYLSGLAQGAYENNYVQPQMHTGYELEISGGRHPVIEKIEKNFISNELFFDQKKYIHIITGPNMGGKSTYLRQNALIVLMAHMGGFVPAKEALIPQTDKIFSRVGASDNLFASSSTFMVEMQEVANILHNSTKKSFVIIDEVGRGTSTYDGMSLAWAILRQNHDFNRAKTLFATHYHELVDESKKLSGVKNFSLAVGENKENIVFLRKVIPGAVKKSYGIEVAKLAGLPQEVIDEANIFLQKFEQKNTGNQLSLGSFETEKIIYKEVLVPSMFEKELEKIDINHTTPMEAFEILAKWKKNL